MDQLTAAVAKHHRRINEIAHVLVRYGFAEWASWGASIPGVRIADIWRSRTSLPSPPVRG